MIRPNFLESPQAWMRTQRTSVPDADYAAALQAYRPAREPLGWIVVRWLSVLILFCMVGAVALGF